MACWAHSLKTLGQSTKPIGNRERRRVALLCCWKPFKSVQRGR